MKLTVKTFTTLAAATALIAAAGLTLSAQGGYGQGQGRGRGRDNNFTTLLSGTYELDRTQGDDPNRAADMATRNMPPQQRDNAMRTMLARLQAPAQLSIIRRGMEVTVSSTNGPQTTFVADGQARRENAYGNQGGYGGNRRQATITTRASFVGDKLTVSSQGDRASDFTVTFDPTDGGNRLIVTRQIWNAGYPNPITARAFYTRVAAEPRWDVYTRTSPLPAYGPGNDPRGNNGAMLLVPQGTRLSAILDTPIDTRTSRVGERFTMTVQGPNEYRDARIDGVVRSVNVYNDNRPTDMRVDFDTIRLRNGQSGPIDAVIDSVRTPGGDNYRVDGNVQNNRDNNNAIQNGAIGAAIGGLIGVIAGGGKGAAIGAAIGGAAGAGGSIMSNNQRDRFLMLPAGTQVTLVTGYGR